MHRNVSFIVISALFVAILILPAVGKKNSSKVNGAKVFAEYCAKCHAGGGNVIKENHPIAGSKEFLSNVVFEDFRRLPFSPSNR